MIVLAGMQDLPCIIVPGGVTLPPINGEDAGKIQTIGDDVIMSPDQAKQQGLTSTVTFPTGNIAPEGSVIKSTSIDPAVVDEDGVYRHTGAAKVYTTEKGAITAIKTGEIKAGDIMVLIGRGPSGTGMEETYQLTSALKHLSYGKYVSLITDARFSGVSTGACIGHVGPEGLAGGPVSKLRDGDIIEIVVDRNRLIGTVNFIGQGNERVTPEEGAEILSTREPHPEMKPDPNLPDDTRLWAALQSVSGVHGVEVSMTSIELLKYWRLVKKPSVKNKRNKTKTCEYASLFTGFTFNYKAR